MIEHGNVRVGAHSRLAVLVALVGALIAAFLHSATPALALGAAPVAMSDGQMKELQRTTNPVNAQFFGYAVDIDGDTAVVGSYMEGSRGAVYIYVRDRGRWVQQARLGNPGAQYFFGTSVAIEGDTVVVGNFNDSTRGYSAGAAYVYIRSGTSWSLQQTLHAPDGVANDNFGRAVAISGDTIALSAPFDDYNGTTRTGGSVRVFTRVGTTWSQQAVLTVAGQYNEYLGYKHADGGDPLDVDGDTLVAGADSNMAGGTGSAYVWRREGASWGEPYEFEPPVPLVTDASFGRHVRVVGDTVVVGSTAVPTYVFSRDGAGWGLDQAIPVVLRGEYSGVTSIDFDGTTIARGRSDEAAPGVEVYRKQAGVWTQEDYLVGTGAVGRIIGNDFGHAVALQGDDLLVGSYKFDTPIRNAGGAVYFFSLTEYATTEEVPLEVAANRGAIKNDYDSENDTLTPSLVDTTTLHGDIVFGDGGSFTYTPEKDFEGTATATYRVHDGTGYSQPATITITVAPVDDAPRGVADSIGCPENGEALLDVLANDIDVDKRRGSLVATGFSEVSTGSIEASSNGEVVYRAPLDWLGAATFTYRVTDGTYTSDPVTATVHVQKTIVTRIDGLDRYVVAARVARHGWDPDLGRSWPGVKHVIIANGEYGREADPLCASGLAGTYDAPILLTKTGELPAATRAVLTEIAARNPGVKVHIVGGPVSVPNARWDDIRAIPGVGPALDRIGGADRYHVSAGIASRMLAVKGKSAIPGVLLVAADTTPAFYDALAASPVAFAKTMPMLAVRKDRIQPPIARLLERELAGKPRYAVSNTRYIGTVPGAGATRLVNTSDRYKASQQIAEQALKRGWLTPVEVGVASKLPDALTGGAFLGKRDGAMLYTDTDDTAAPSATQFVDGHNNRILIGWILGGHASVPEAQEDAFWQLLE